MKKITKAAAAALSAALLASCAPADIDLEIGDTEINHISNDSADTPVTQEIIKTDDGVVTGENTCSSLEAFCTEFLLTAAEKSDEASNTVLSPLSAYLALAMLKDGAGGETLLEMSDVMGDISGLEIHTLISDLTTLNETTLNISNSVWVDDSFELRASYTERLYRDYFAEGFALPLKTAEKQINSYIEEHTNGLIKDMLDESALDDTVMALVNTLYMKAKWQNPFSKEATHEREFTDALGNKSAREFLYKTASYRVIEDDDCIGVVIPYSDGALEFAAVMPKNEASSASDALSSIAQLGGWAKTADDAEYERIKLYIPRLEQETAGSLTDTLKAMGITSAFDKNRADFSGIAEDIFVNDVFQNAVLKLDEEGTEAAAATVITMMATSARPPEEEPRTVEFNRPFAFAVIHKDSGAVLFAGEHNMP